MVNYKNEEKRKTIWIDGIELNLILGNWENRGCWKLKSRKRKIGHKNSKQINEEVRTIIVAAEIVKKRRRGPQRPWKEEIKIVTSHLKFAYGETTSYSSGENTG